MNLSIKLGLRQVFLQFASHQLTIFRMARDLNTAKVEQLVLPLYYIIPRPGDFYKSNICGYSLFIYVNPNDCSISMVH